MCACVKNLTCVGAKQAELFNFVSAAKAPIATQAHTHVLLPDLWCAYVCMLRMCVCCVCVCVRLVVCGSPAIQSHTSLPNTMVAPNL